MALTARTQADLDSVAAEIRALGRRAITVAGDISDEAVMDTLVARTVADKLATRLGALKVQRQLLRAPDDLAHVQRAHAAPDAQVAHAAASSSRGA